MLTHHDTLQPTVLLHHIIFLPATITVFTISNNPTQKWENNRNLEHGKIKPEPCSNCGNAISFPESVAALQSAQPSSRTRLAITSQSDVFHLSRANRPSQKEEIPEKEVSTDPFKKMLLKSLHYLTSWTEHSLDAQRQLQTPRMFFSSEKNAAKILKIR
jgi:hypothetical protein